MYKRIYWFGKGNSSPHLGIHLCYVAGFRLGQKRQHKWHREWERAVAEKKVLYEIVFQSIFFLLSFCSSTAIGLGTLLGMVNFFFFTWNDSIRRKRYTNRVRWETMLSDQCMAHSSLSTAAFYISEHNGSRSMYLLMKQATRLLSRTQVPLIKCYNIILTTFFLVINIQHCYVLFCT